jgi:hypothetical protein
MGEGFDWKFSSDDRRPLPAILYTHLKRAIERNRDLLMRSRRRGDIAVVAWLTRNLVELKVWAEYCATSEEKALEFCDDAIRDLIELNRKIPGLDGETKAELDRAEAGLPTVKASHKFKDIKDAATEVGLETFYKTNFKSLSKFAHPTALSVMATPTDSGAKVMRDEFVKVGTTIADEALMALEKSLMRKRHDKYASTIAKINKTLPRDKQVH